MNTTAFEDRSAWATALMPIVLHELNNATQFLSMLHKVASGDPGADMLERSAFDLGKTASAVEDLGLLMAILSTTSGTDLLMERRSGRGVSVMVAATVKLIRKAGSDVQFIGIKNPIALSSRGQGWELPWALGASMWIASERMSKGQTLEVSIHSSGWSAGFGGSDRMRSHADAVGECLPEARGVVTGTAWEFYLPEGWLTSGEK